MAVCGAVLAAGAGRRFGAAKQLAPLDGRPLLQWALDAACGARSLDDVVVVLGARADDVRRGVRLGRARAIECREWAEGLAASLRCAVAAATRADPAGGPAPPRAPVPAGPSIEWLVVTLGDEPRMTPDAIDAVVDAAWAAPAEVAAVRARWGDRPGHPVALRRTLFGAVGELRGDAGARQLLRDQVVLEVECGPAEAAVDVDTPEDLRRLTS